MQRARRLTTAAAGIDYASYLTRRSLARQPSAIRALQPLVGLPGMISLGGGMPNPSTFPFSRIQIELKDGPEIELSGKSLEAALQYSPTPGLPPLVAHLRRLQEAEHGAAANHEICVTTGSADALSKTFDALLDEKSALLVESPTFSGSLAYLQPIGCGLAGVECDRFGIIPDAMDRILREWDEEREGRPRPRVLYTIPNGGNPTGVSLDLARKRRLYEVAREWSILILEDDPYHWLQVHPITAPNRTQSHLSQRHHTHPSNPTPCNLIESQTKPYHTLLYHTIPYHTIPYFTIPYHTIPYHTLPYHTIPYHAIQYHTSPYHTLQYNTMPYHTIPHHTIPYHTTQ